MRNIVSKRKYHNKKTFATLINISIGVQHLLGLRTHGKDASVHPVNKQFG